MKKTLNDDVRRENRKRAVSYFSFVIVTIGLLVLFIVSLNIGSIQVSFKQLMDGLFVAYDESVATIYDLRFPRIFISILAGAAISVSGVLFQAVLKNPLADPGIIGISSGASLAAVLVMALVPSLYFLTPLFAFLGGILAFSLVYSLSWKEGLSPLRIILVGVAVNAMFVGLVNAIGAMSGGSSGVASIVNGNITMKTWADVSILFPYVLLGLALALMFSDTLNILSLEDRTACSLGIEVNKLRFIISLIAVLLASISTAVTGVVGFLGLIVPHIGRLLVGSDHKKLIPFSALLGGNVFLLADTIGRTVAYPHEISAAIIMSVIGGPFFIMLLRRSKSYGK